MSGNFAQIFNGTLDRVMLTNIYDNVENYINKHKNCHKSFYHYMKKDGSEEIIDIISILGKGEETKYILVCNDAPCDGNPNYGCFYFVCSGFSKREYNILRDFFKIHNDYYFNGCDDCEETWEN